MIEFRCRKYGDDEWTDVVLDGPVERTAMMLMAGSLAASGSYDVQYKENGEWVQLAEMDFDDNKDPE